MKIASLALNIFNVILLIGSFGFLIPTVMIFDAPGSTEKKGLWFVFWVFGLFPVVVIGSLVVGWIKWWQGDYLFALKAGGAAWAYAVVAFMILFSILEK